VTRIGMLEGYVGADLHASHEVLDPSDLTSARLIDVGIGVSEIGPVESVESIQAEFHFGAFGEGKGFQQRHIGGSKAGAG
jgi:hypothetical protein